MEAPSTYKSARARIGKHIVFTSRQNHHTPDSIADPGRHGTMAPIIVAALYLAGVGRTLLSQQQKKQDRETDGKRPL
jgi:hypothetical protein